MPEITLRIVYECMCNNFCATGTVGDQSFVAYGAWPEEACRNFLHEYFKTQPATWLLTDIDPRDPRFLPA